MIKMVLFFMTVLAYTNVCFSVNPHVASMISARKNNPFLTLAYQAKCGNKLSLKTYETYCDIVAGRKNPRHLSDKEVIKKLISLNLCHLVKGKLQIQDFYVNDELFKLSKKKQR